MLKSNRDNLFAIGLAVLLAICAGAWIYNDASRLERVYQHRAEQNAQAYRNTAAVHAQRACTGETGTKLSECVHEQYHSARERERNEYDLQAQLVTSVWTRAMGLAALIATGVGILGVGLVYTTFNATREGNVIARENAAPYLELEPTTHLACKNQPQNPTYVITDVANHGQTKAQRLSISCEMEISGGFFPRRALTQTDGSPLATLTPNGKTYFRWGDPELKFTADEIRQVGGATCTIWFLIAYDGNDGKRITEARTYAGEYFVAGGEGEFPVAKVPLKWVA